MNIGTLRNVILCLCGGRADHPAHLPMQRMAGGEPFSKFIAYSVCLPYVPIGEENARDVVCCYKTRSCCGSIYLIWVRDYPWFLKPLALRRSDIQQCKVGVCYAVKV